MKIERGNARRDTIAGAWRIAILIALIISGTRLFGQSITGGIFGTVKDSTGAILPKATITATNIATGLVRTATTGDSGDYSIGLLPVGEYRVTAELTGFKTAVVQGVVVQIDQKTRIDITLTVGEITEEILVTGEAPLVKTSSSDIGDVIENKRVVELPLNGRQFTRLILLAGTSTKPPTGTHSRFQRTGLMPSVNGQREFANNYMLDGVTAMSPYLNTLAISPSVDAVQEFKVQTGIYSAELGQQSGGQVNITTKSGTNSFHGTLFEFLRNDVFDAHNFFDNKSEPVPKLRQNNFGGTFGGPVVKNRSFFFVNYEGLRVRQAITQTTIVPTAAQREGDLSFVPFPIIDPFTGQPFPGNIVPRERIHPISRAFAALWPLPNLMGAGQNFVGAPIQTNDQDQFTVKSDQRFSDRDSLSVRYSFQDVDELLPFESFSILQLQPFAPGFGVRTKTRSGNAAINYTRVFNPKLLNEFRFGYLRFRSGFRQQNDQLDFAGIHGIRGTNRANPGNLGIPQVAMPSFATIGDNIATFETRGDNIFQWVDNVLYTAGSHTLKFGGEVRRTQSAPFIQLLDRGAFVFLGAFSHSDFADFLLELPTLAFVSVGNTQVHLRNFATHFYLQDDWKATPNLTLNLGLRYEFNSKFKEKFNRLSVFDPEFPGGRFVAAGTRRTDRFFPPELAARVAPFLAFADEAGFPEETLLEADPNSFAPRFGFAYSPPFGRRNLVIRGGYGIFYDAIPVFNQGGIAQTPPFFSLFGGFNFLFRTVTDALEGIKFGPIGSSGTLTRDSQKNQPYVQQWSLNIQYNVSPNHLIEAAYLGNKGTHLATNVDLNPAAPGPGPRQPRSLFPNFGQVNDVGRAIGKSTYHALMLRAEKRLSHGLAFVAVYTLSKSIDTQSNPLINDTGSLLPQDSRNLEAEKGLSNFDARHRFVLSYTYELPLGPGKRFLSNRSGFWGSFLEGWMLTGIATLSSGFPFSVELLSDISNTQDFPPDRPNLVGDPNKGPKTPERFFNTAAFAIQPPLSFGNAGRNIVIGPSFQNFDLSIIKTTSISENHRIEFRSEFFNLFNRANFNLPNRFADSPVFGRILSAGFPRIIQFGLKYVF